MCRTSGLVVLSWQTLALENVKLIGIYNADYLHLLYIHYTLLPTNVMKCYLIFCDDPEKANLHFSVSKLIQGSAGTGLIRSNQNIVKNCKSSCGRAK